MTGNCGLWWLGQSGFLVQWQKQYLLLDPYLSDSLTRKYAATDKPHVRMTVRAVDPAALDFIDVVTSSHNHTDHLDGETLGPILRANPNDHLVVAEANRQFVADRLRSMLAIPVGIAIGDATSIATSQGHFASRRVPAKHDEMRADVVGYIVRCGPWTIYHSGDTLLYDGMAERLRPFPRWMWRCCRSMVQAPERRVAGNLNGAESAHLAKAIGARTVIPCHYEMFEFNTADPRDVRRRVQEHRAALSRIALRRAMGKRRAAIRQKAA